MNEKEAAVQILLPESNSPAFHFVKNEQNEREMKPVARENMRTLIKEKTIGVVVIGHMHMGGVSDALLNTLSAQAGDLNEILLIDKQGLGEIGIIDDNRPRQELFEFKNFIHAEDLTEILLKVEKKPYKEKNIHNFHKHHNPQKLRNGSGYAKKHRQRKR